MRTEVMRLRKKGRRPYKREKGKISKVEMMKKEKRQRMVNLDPAADMPMGTRRPPFNMA